MKRFILLLVLVCTCLTGCFETFGDGKVDLVEEAMFRSAVSSALIVYPEVALPVYEVSTALLSIDMEEVVLFRDLATVIDMELLKLGLTDTKTTLFHSFISHVKEKMTVLLALSGKPETYNLKAVLPVLLRIIQESSMPVKG